MLTELINILRKSTPYFKGNPEAEDIRLHIDIPPTGREKNEMTRNQQPTAATEKAGQGC